MYKTKIFFDIDKEMAWLNQMAEEGYRLEEKSCFTYKFEKCEPNQYMYQVEKRSIEFLKEDREYIEFLRDLEIGFVGHTLGYYYFEKANDGKPFAIYSDGISRIKHYTKIMKVLAILAIINIGIINSHLTEPTGPWIIHTEQLSISFSFWSNIICLIGIIVVCIKYSRRIIKLKKVERIQEI